QMRRLALVVWVIGGAAIALAQQPASSGVERPAVTSAVPAGQHWVATWGTAQQMYRAAPPAGAIGSRVGASPAPSAQPAPNAPPPASAFPPRRFANPPAVQVLNNQTVRMIARTSLAG